MVIKVPIAGWEKAKRWSGFSVGVDWQEARSRSRARKGKVRWPKVKTRRKAKGPKTVARGCSNIVLEKERPANLAGLDFKPCRAVPHAWTTGTTAGSLK